ncbi:amino acid deaminase/aldolase [Corynebacterium sp.]|uniref:amino acid deaminase/aldolase n=1 Tax=Corynebacterium sp. TaxID=1720 RepID=UPI0025BC301B|nr:amino acid deaminase/aldolase [Corynebacterium sp.]
MSTPRPAVREAVAHLDAPFSVLDLDNALANAGDMVRRAGGTPIRLATKSVRILPLIRRLLDRPGFRGLLSYSLGEALWLADEGVSDDILVAYPSADRQLLHQLMCDEAYLRTITVMVDSVEHLDFIDAVVPPTERGVLRVCVDIDASLAVGPVHLGARRSPVHSVEQARTLARQVHERDGFALVGLMAYEGQIAGTTDSSPLVTAVKRVSARELAGRRAAIVDAVRSVGVDLEFVNGGGTGSIESTVAETAVTEIGAGSGVVGPGLFDNYSSFRPLSAEWFVLPVVRRPAPDFITVAGGGRIASGPPGTDRQPVVDYPRGLSLTSTEGAGEVQTPLRGEVATAMNLGDHVWFRHAKAGEQAEFTDTVLVVSDGDIIDEWTTYRGEGRIFT